MPLKSLTFLFLALALILGASACDDDDPIKATDEGSDTDALDPDADQLEELEEIDPNCITILDPMGDLDEDGIPNIKEDKNANCRFDADATGSATETDFQNPDTDGDGLLDGQEDVNANGIWDAGEPFSPRKTDSNDNGISDYDEYHGCLANCDSSIFDAVSNQPAQFALSTVALPSSYALTQHQDAKAMTFSNPNAGVFGLVIATPAASTNAGIENSNNILKVARGPNDIRGDLDDNIPTISFSTEFSIPSPDWLPGTQYSLETPINGVRIQAMFSYGNNAPNPLQELKTPSALRDEIVTAISGFVIDTAESSTACRNLSAYWLAQLRTDDWTVNRPQGSNLLVTTVIIACENQLSNDEVAFLFSDILSGTQTAPGNFTTDRSRAQLVCQQMTGQPDGGAVDFLWVIDNSGSMADEQANVANTADIFMQILRNAGLEWRVGVTTTEAYLHFADPPDPLSHDELLDSPTALRGAGMLRWDSNDSANLFRQYVTYDQDCERRDQGQLLAPLHSNICGNGLEDGLASGLRVLEAMSTDLRNDFKLRPEARLAVIWVSDEEIQAVKLDDGVTSVGRADPRWVSVVEQYINGYRQRFVRGYAIVGDAQLANGGICQPLPNLPSAITGAQHGQTYLEVATALNGGAGSICASSLQETIDAMVRDMVFTASNYQLTGFPVASSLRVSINGTAIPRSRSQGWDYDPRTNAIVFYDQNITLGACISVTYLMWGELDAG